ncbi:MAG: DNA-binding protein [Candidatus Acididesulfobacter diazotrophicus]|uniref:DNA-binding protein n=1 Tax=Candidatus Acididesulfobacter diazotrophicus TaxID=2597226 RepID=A0A519BKC1_9DELT|nr:MAG: DNA-binding protein [Candidatus Acididesulfobacter diazotrophicus]
MKQTAEYLNVSTRMVKRYMSARRISFVKIFGQYRFRLEDLDKFIMDNRILSLNEQRLKISFPAEKIRN